MSQRKDHPAWGFLALLALPVLCCGLPALLAAGVLAGVGSWLATHGFWVAGGALLLVSLAVGAWRRLSRRSCDPSTGAPSS